MSPSAIYSKSGKGVQEASGKTSLLKRADRAVLSAIDGRANLGEVAQKVGKPFDAAFKGLIAQLDKDGFVRELSAANAAANAKPAPRPGAAVSGAPAKPAAPPAASSDLDFTGIMTTPMRKAPADDVAARRAKEQEAALYKARQEAEARAQEQRERTRIDTEGKARAETEARIRAETEKKLRAEAEAKVKALAEAKAKAAREAAVRMAQEAKAKAEAEAKAKIEAERRAREEAERKAKEEAEQARREAEQLRVRLEQERKAREEAERLAQEQEAQMRRAREEAERKRAEAERLEAERREAEARERREAEAREQREAQARSAEAKPAGGLDALMADLDSFSRRDDDDRSAREATAREALEEKQRMLREAAEERERELAAREQAERERRAREEEARRAQDDEERRAREEDERARVEAEERERSALEALAARQALEQSDDIGVTEDDLGMDDVRRDEAAVPQESRKARREREREAKRLEKEARARDRAAAKAAKAAAKAEAESVRYSPPRRPRKWGRPVAVGLFVLLLAGLGVLHVIPVPTEEYQRAASEALRQPVRIGSARLSLYSGLRLNLEAVSIGGRTKIASARAYPRLGALFSDLKAFSRIELDGVTLAQRDVGQALFARANGANFAVDRILVKDLRLAGPVPLPVMEVDVRIGADGKVRTALLRGPEGLMGQLMPRSDSVEFELTAASMTLPFAPEVALGSFAMKGEATRLGMRIESWGGSLLGGALSGSANLRWGGSWALDGVLTARNVNAAVFAPALLSEGNAEGRGKFSMSGAEPAKLLRSGRVEGSFTIGKGVLGSFDLARAIRTRGEEVNGRTQFVELNGQASYDGGAVALRNVTIGAGALQAGASADISQSGALSGRIVADVRTASQSLRATLNLGGTVKEPQVRN